MAGVITRTDKLNHRTPFIGGKFWVRLIHIDSNSATQDECCDGYPENRVLSATIKRVDQIVPESQLENNHNEW